MRTPDLAVADALTRFFREAALEGLVSAYLFGSLTRGATHRESDIDIAVLLEWTAYPTRGARFEVRIRLAGRLGHVVGHDEVDLLILNDVPPGLARGVVTTGRRVYCANEARDHAFIRTTLLRAADLEPFLRRTRRVKLAAIAR